MKTSHWKIGNKVGRAGAVLALCGLAGCAFFPHRERTAPCSDYKAARFAPAAAPGDVPCDEPLPMVRPPWTAALEPAPDGAIGG